MQMLRSLPPNQLQLLRALFPSYPKELILRKLTHILDVNAQNERRFADIVRDAYPYQIKRPVIVWHAVNCFNNPEGRAKLQSPLIV